MAQYLLLDNNRVGDRGSCDGGLPMTKDEILREISGGAVSCDAGTYVEVQIDRRTWEALRAIPWSSLEPQVEPLNPAYPPPPRDGSRPAPDMRRYVEPRAEPNVAELFHGLMDLVDDWTLRVEDSIRSQDLNALLDDPRYCAAEAGRAKVNRQAEPVAESVIDGLARNYFAIVDTMRRVGSRAGSMGMEVHMQAFDEAEKALRAALNRQPGAV